jgi:hypothetical protein
MDINKGRTTKAKKAKHITVLKAMLAKSIMVILFGRFFKHHALWHIFNLPVTLRQWLAEER